MSLIGSWYNMHTDAEQGHNFISWLYCKIAYLKLNKIHHSRLAEQDHNYISLLISLWINYITKVQQRRELTTLTHKAATEHK